MLCSGHMFVTKVITVRGNDSIPVSIESEKIQIIH